MTAPSPFSKSVPTLQTAWDSTSLASLMKCPRRYQYEIIEGYRGSKIDLEFGLYFASAMETFLKAQVRGASNDEATIEAVKKALEISGRWEPTGVIEQGHTEEQWIPWGGRYEMMWHCLGDVPYKNKKGNKAKCPFAHKGAWFMDAPSICGECGGTIEEKVRYLPTSPIKNRRTLLRMVVWYCDEQVGMDEEGVKPFVFPNGTPAVELSFKLPLPFDTPDGEPYILAGHLDAMKQLGEEVFPSDNKTSKNALNQNYWQGFSPNIQVDVYDLAASILFPTIPVKGVMIEGAQTLQSGARFGRHVFYKTEEQREELLGELEWWIKQAERYAQDNYWPMNRANCFLCPFKKVCSTHPARRKAILDADFERNHWNPLEER